MAQRVYIETTFISYLTARPSRDIVLAGHQQVTHEWWDARRGSYELCVSQLVLGESAAGDPQAAQERLAILQVMTFLETTPAAFALAKELVRAGALPTKARDDALHIAVAATQGVPYLLTWNCRHMANAAMRPLIESVCASKGFKAPILCTPEELLETTL
jgi:predicted nucleic acid-binding protein